MFYIFNSPNVDAAIGYFVNNGPHYTLTSNRNILVYHGIFVHPENDTGLCDLHG